MHILKAEKFVNYEPIIDKNPQFLVDKIKNKASKYMNNTDLEKIQKAYEYARKMHKGQKRHSGERYIIHPVLSTDYLMMLKPDIDSIQACLLHDVIEDTSADYEDIQKAFGTQVANLCKGLVKVSKIRYTGEDRKLETLKKTFLAMAQDIRVIFIKLADRIHNTQTFKYHPSKEKQKILADETLKIFVRMARRLGLYVFQGYLENGSFYILDKEEFERIAEYIKKEYGTDDEYIKKGKNYIHNIMKEANIENYKIKGRFKSPYRIYRKLQKYHTTDISEVLDILAFRIIVENTHQCYQVLGYVHENYTPIMNKVKDYIAIPKSNGYQSLHTTILKMFDFPVELQIRTKQMNKVAEHGQAAHFVYKESGGSQKQAQEFKLKWINTLKDIVKNYQKHADKNEFKEELKINIFDKYVHVYTPKGDVIELPDGATILDFAFKIHTEIGLKYKSALVNGKIVPKDYQLQDGEIVEINTYKRKKTATKKRIKQLKTTKAKSKLKRHLRKERKDKFASKGKEILNDKLKEYNLPELHKGKITDKFSDEDMEEIYLKFYEGQIKPTQFIKKHYPHEFKNKKANKKRSQKAKVNQIKEDLSNMIIIDGHKNINYELCPVCKPQPGDKIIGKTCRKNIKIHTLKCSAINKISYDKFVSTNWDKQGSNTYFLDIKLSIKDSPGSLSKILKVFMELNINIKKLKTLNDDKTKNISKIKITLGLENPSKMEFIFKNLKKKKNLLEIISKEIS